MALLADAAVLLRAHALLHAAPVERALLCEMARQQGELNFEPCQRSNQNVPPRVTSKCTTLGGHGLKCLG
jgi:hypothetical protein